MQKQKKGGKKKATRSGKDAKPVLRELKSRLLADHPDTKFPRDIATYVNEVKAAALLESAVVVPGSEADFVELTPRARCQPDLTLAQQNGWSVWTGLALRPDGSWSPHIWYRDGNGKTIDTIALFDAYFGVECKPRSAYVLTPDNDRIEGRIIDWFSSYYEFLIADFQGDGLEVGGVVVGENDEFVGLLYPDEDIEPSDCGGIRISRHSHLAKDESPIRIPHDLDWVSTARHLEEAGIDSFLLRCLDSTHVEAFLERMRAHN